MNLQATLKATIGARFSNPGGVGTTTQDISQVGSVALLNGNLAGEANKIWSDQRTLGASANEDLDLSGAALQDAFGNDLAFTIVKGIYVAAAAGNGGNIQVGGAGANAFVNWVGANTELINVPPGGVFLLATPDGTGFAVTAGTGDLLRIANTDGAASATYDIILVGVE